MNYITWEYLIDILQYTQDYQDCIQLLISCKTFYHNTKLNKLIKEFYTNIYTTYQGNKFYIFNGKKHRTKGPSIKYESGTKIWYQYGKFHNLNGPAIQYFNGDKQYYIWDIKYTKKEYNEKIKKLTK